MKKITLIIAVTVAGLLLKHKFQNREQSGSKPLKLSGFAISAPTKAGSQQGRAPQSGQINSRRSTVSSKQLDFRSKTQSYFAQIDTPAERIERAKIAWIKIRSKALDRLRVDSQTREEMDELKKEFANNEMFYTEKLKELIGEDGFEFLYSAREQFKSRVFERLHIDIGPHLGSAL